MLKSSAEAPHHTGTGKARLHVQDVPQLMLYRDVCTTLCSWSCFRPLRLAFKTGIMALPLRDKCDAQPILSSAVLRGAYCTASCALLGDSCPRGRTCRSSSDAPRLLGSTGDARIFRCAACARWLWPAVVIRRYHQLRIDCGLGTRVSSRTHGQYPSAYDRPITFAQLLSNKKRIQRSARLV